VQSHDLAPAEGTARAAAVLLHPHPDMGGDRFNNVVSELYRTLPAAGVVTIRFDFSTSRIDAAASEALEALDVLDAVDELPAEVARLLVGYSFGGGVAATITDERLAGWFLVAPAISTVEPTIGGDPRPKAIVTAQHDQFFPPDDVEAMTAGWQGCEVTSVAGADHFFVGRTDVVAERCLEWIRRVVP